MMALYVAFDFAEKSGTLIECKGIWRHEIVAYPLMLDERL
jgi:hypothetical protein